VSRLVYDEISFSTSVHVGSVTGTLYRSYTALWQERQKIQSWGKSRLILQGGFCSPYILITCGYAKNVLESSTLSDWLVVMTNAMQRNLLEVVAMFQLKCKK